MAPSLEDPVFLVGSHPVHVKCLGGLNKFDYEPGRTVVEKHDDYAHEDFLPSFPAVRWDPLPPLPYEDKGLLGDPNYKNLLNSTADVFDYTPKIGTEILGVNLAALTDAQKNDLARLIAVRGVVFFRAQDNFDIEAQRDLGRYFGSLHKV
jgi:taurine dioxygenase